MGPRVVVTLLLLGAGLLLGVEVNAAELHVSPTGNDTNAGTLEQPLASVAAAQRAARALAQRGPVTVWLHAGTYYLPDTIRFTPEDSGCTYAALDGQTAVISGGTKLELQWTPFRDGIMKATTPDGLALDQLFVNGKLQAMARYPNFDAKVSIYNGHAADATGAARAARWSNPAGGYIHALHKARWGGLHFRITGKDDKGELTYEGGWQNNRPSEMHRDARFVENVFEELDAPGEWFHDAADCTLYYLPPADVDMKAVKVESVRLRHLVEFHGTKEKPVKNITLRGLVFRHAARTFMETKEPLLRSDWAIYRGGAILFKDAEDCAVADSEFDQVGGNAIFVSGYNRRLTISGCNLHDTGASAVAFVGEPVAVRSPLFNYDKKATYHDIDKTPGPKTDDYPSDCLVDDCLIFNVGTVEKQAAGVQISMAMNITVRHCSIYRTSRAGINIGEGAFGGHVIEFCDVFDTVRETGDHGSFNSWGRDRFWALAGAPGDELPALARLDMVRPNTLRNSRWRCDHGWDVDLDDGSSNYEIYNNVFLRGGLKLREGFHRKVWNNVAVDSTLHPHVWFDNSGDEVTRNIWMGSYRPALMRGAKWGKEVDRNFFATSDADRTKFARQGCDANSLAGDPMFVDPAKGDFRVREGSPALKMGFVNFPMDQFGVRSARLRAIALTPEIPVIKGVADAARSAAKTQWRGATLRVLKDGEFSALGVAQESKGLVVADVEIASKAFADGVRAGDFLQALDGQDIQGLTDFQDRVSKTTASKLTVIREQRTIEVIISR